MYEEFLGGEKESEDLGAEAIDETIIHIQGLLDDGFYDEEVRDEAVAMLNKARNDAVKMLNKTQLSMRDTRAIEQIDVLLDDIETRYRKNE